MVKQAIQPLGHPVSVCLSAEGKFQNLFSDLFLHTVPYGSIQD
jgi:hypothetical protein